MADYTKQTNPFGDSVAIEPDDRNPFGDTITTQRGSVNPFGDSITDAPPTPFVPQARPAAPIEGFLGRTAKQTFNVGVAQPVQAIGVKSKVGETGTLLNTMSLMRQDFRYRAENNLPVTKAEVEQFTKPFKKWSVGWLFGSKREQWEQDIWNQYQTGKLNTQERTAAEGFERLNTFATVAKLQTAEQTNISLAVSQDQGLKAKAADVIGGITGFALQLGALRKAFPSAPDAFIWELQNQVTGGETGKGVASYAALAGPGKLIKGTTTATKAGKLGAESAALASLTAIEQKLESGEINWEDVAISAGLPFALRTPGMVKRLFSVGNKNVLIAANKVANKPRIRVMGEIGRDSKVADFVQSDALLQKWAESTKPLLKEKKLAVKRLRRRQAGRAGAILKTELGKGTSVYRSILKSVAGYKDQAIIPDVEPPRLTEAQWEGYAKKILDIYPASDASTQFQKTDTLTALNQMRSGKIPTNRQFQLLEPIFGRKLTENLYLNLNKHRTFSGWQIPGLAIQLFKLKFGLDIQTSRQARSLAPRHPVLYTKSVLNNIKAYLSNEQSQKIIDGLMLSPGYDLSAKYVNYVGDVGYSSKRLEYYGLGLTERLLVSKSKTANLVGRLFQRSEQGAVAGINTMMKGVWDSREKALAHMENATPERIEQWRVNNGKTINTFMKVLRAKSPNLKELQRVANYFLFSPSMTAARPLSIKALLANKGSRGYAAQVITLNIGSIMAASGIAALIGSHLRSQDPSESPDIDGSINPLSSNFGKIRHKNQVIDLSGGDAPFYRTIARLGVSAYLAGREQVTGKKITKIGTQYAPSASETLMRYGESRETAALGLAKTLVTGKDWLGEDIPRLNAVVQALSPETVQSIVETGMADGTWEALAAGIGTTMSVGWSTYPVRAAATRSKFRDYVARETQGKLWDDLTPVQQKKLEVQYKKQFDKLNQKIQAERIESPYSPERLIDQERKDELEIRSKLNTDIQSTLSGVPIGVSRTVEKFRLNDDRFHQYKQLLVQNLNEKIKPIDPNTANRKAVLEKRISIAKRLAQQQIMREIRTEKR